MGSDSGSCSLSCVLIMAVMKWISFHCIVVLNSWLVS